MSSRKLLANYGHFVLLNRLGGLSLPKNNVVRLLNDCPDMIIAVKSGR